MEKIMDDDTILLLVDNIIKEFKGRKGFDDVFDSIEDDRVDGPKIFLGLKQSLINIIKAAI